MCCVSHEGELWQCLGFEAVMRLCCGNHKVVFGSHKDMFGSYEVVFGFHDVVLLQK